MYRLALGMALLIALAIIAIGTQYIVAPRAAAANFGLKPPEEGPNIAWWLRLKGVRDIASGLTVLAFMACGQGWAVGLFLLVATSIALGDMLVILASKGSTKHALGMHGVTAVVMVLTAVTLMTGAGTPHVPNPG